MTEKNVIYQEKEETLSFVQIGMEILRVARNELYLNMRFLDVALSNLRFVPDGQIRGLGTDGDNLYFQPDGVVALFRKGRPVMQPGLSAQYRTLSVLPPLESEGPGCGNTGILRVILPPNRLSTIYI